ncbi:PaaX family transcriptional regulator [Blastococcus xanthinilyticus]|uniref:PaaX family transcriptional regulator n=1 Tax=Blastococcus xanthinilyticus TaxID=1564164 RepID=A0A5S5D2Q2_9ACTN|nr:PaaX family transcriptional regulator C-terminal domain-containing protein [Blastococcus xanthinilyticus]TYP90317.1 PaaX family transcriptional regulator [Blastococcus xanthinilyticus]
MTERGAGASPKPQDLLFALGGALVLEHLDEPVPTRVFLEVLGNLGVGQAATRATLTRLTERGFLARSQEGRVVSYALTASSRRLLEEGRDRVRAEAPFHQESSDWTLLSFSLPEAHRDVRHRLRSRLAWVGFGCVRDGLWMAPGQVPLDRVLTLPVTDESVQIDGFVVRPAPGTDVGRLVRRAWDLDALRREHEAFIARWEGPPARDLDPVAAYTLLGAHWIRLLRQDPVLPQVHLGEDWPAARSAAVHRSASEALEPSARAAFTELMAWARTLR